MPGVKQIKQAMLDRSPRKPVIPDENWISLGATPLNLAVSGRARVGIAKGMYVWYVGDTSSGKTWFTMLLLAEASINPNFAKHKFYYDNAERGAWMDFAKYFGPRMAARIEPPPAVVRKTKGGAPRIVCPAEPSTKSEEFYWHLDTALRAGPCIYILDSMDCLEGAADEAKFLEIMGAPDPDKVKGTYGMAVAQSNSRNIKRYMSRLDQTGSILVIINQLRANIKTNPYQHGPDKKPGQGGFALSYYASVELWTRVVGKLRRTVMGKERNYGKLIAIDVKKNRVSGDDDRTVVIPFLRQHGIDELGACVNFLLEEKWWKAAASKKDKPQPQEMAVRGTEEKEKVPKSFAAPEFGFVGNAEDLISKIVVEKRMGELSRLVEKVWGMIENATLIKRPSRYS